MEDESLTGIGRAAARLSRLVERGLSHVGLTPAQYRMLALLEEGAAQASEMAQSLTVSRPSVTAVVDGLVAAGLVERRHDEQDRRRVGHRITAKGLEALNEADSKLDSWLGMALDYTDDGEAAQRAVDGLAEWARALDAWRIAHRAERSRGRAGVTAQPPGRRLADSESHR